MKPEWRSEAVAGLCRWMLDARAYHALPVLADALEDAGCADAALLAACRDPALSAVRAERLVNLVYSDETAAAVRWLEQFVRDINYEDDQDDNAEVGTPGDGYPHTYEYIVEAGRQGITEGSMSFGSDAGADFFRESDDNRREFFRNWSLVTGVAVPDEAQERVRVGCAC
jgi:hypothetical protein